MPLPIIAIGVAVATSVVMNRVGWFLGQGPGRPFIVPNMMPRPQVQIPQISGLTEKGGTVTYGWAGQTNSAGPGLPVPLLGGKCRVGLQLINHYLRSTTSADVLYALYAVCEGEVDAVVLAADEDNIWLTEDLKLKELGGEWDSNIGTKDQAILTNHEYLHQIHEVRWPIEEPVHGVWHFDTVRTDASADDYFDSNATTNAPLLLNGNATIEAALMKFGAGAAEFPGAAGDYLSTTGSPRWHLGAEDFTIEVWLRHEAVTASRTYTIIKWQDASDNTGWNLNLEVSATSTTWRFEMARNAGSSNGNSEWITAMANDTWYHLSVNRYGGAIRFYLDGVDVTDYISNTQGQWLPAPSGNPDLCVGLQITGTTAYNWYGYLDDLKFVRGKCLRKGAFTVPAAAIPVPEYAESTVVRTKGKSHEQGFTFSLPSGLYDTAETHYETSLSLNISFRDVDWPADEWGIINGMLQDGVSHGRLSMTGGIQHGFKRQWLHRNMCVNYDAKDPSDARLLDMLTHVGEISYVIGQTSAAAARLEYDYALTATTGILYLQMYGDSEIFEENEVIRISFFGTNSAGKHTGGNDELTVMTSAGKSWPVDSMVGMKIENETNSSTGVITSNTATTITCAAGLSGGADWDTNDDFSIYYDVTADAVPTGYTATETGKCCYV